MGTLDSLSATLLRTCEQYLLVAVVITALPLLQVMSDPVVSQHLSIILSCEDIILDLLAWYSDVVRCAVTVHLGLCFLRVQRHGHCLGRTGLILDAAEPALLLDAMRVAVKRQYELDWESFLAKTSRNLLLRCQVVVGRVEKVEGGESAGDTGGELQAAVGWPVEERTSSSELEFYFHASLTCLD